MISADCSRILDETARAYGFSESVRKADKESLEELLGCAVDIAKKLHLLYVNTATVSVESGRNQHKYVVQIDFALVTGETSPSLVSLKQAMRNVKISADGRVAVLDSAKFSEKENMFTCQYEFLSTHSAEKPHRFSTTVAAKKTNRTPIPNISKVSAPTYASSGSKQKTFTVVEKKRPTLDDDDDDNEVDAEAASLNEEDLFAKKPTEHQKKRLNLGGGCGRFQVRKTLPLLRSNKKLFERSSSTRRCLKRNKHVLHHFIFHKCKLYEHPVQQQ